LVGVVALALAPLAFFLWFVYTRDKLNPEPRGLVLRIFGLGLLVSVPIWMARQFLPLPPGFMGLAVVPMLAELAKFAVVRLGVYDHPEFDEPVDGIIFAAVAGLGFATLTLLGTTIWAYLGVMTLGVPGASGEVWRAVLRILALQGLLIAPGQALWSSLWGFGLGMAKFQPLPRRNRLIFPSLGLAMLSHAMFNAFAMAPGGWPNRLGMGVMVIILWFAVMRCLDHALAASSGTPQKN
jgi:RsiW-degrading membrane proteinase PrsW (M82 family)